MSLKDCLQLAIAQESAYREFRIRIQVTSPKQFMLVRNFYFDIL
jgi:hypothetical protein